MGEVDDAAQIEDERQPERHQDVEGADDEAVGDVVEIEFHHWLRSWPARRRRGKRLAERPGASVPMLWSPVRRRQAGHCSLQPVSVSAGAVLSPGTTWSTRKR